MIITFYGVCQWYDTEFKLQCRPELSEQDRCKADARMHQLRLDNYMYSCTSQYWRASVSAHMFQDVTTTWPGNNYYSDTHACPHVYHYIKKNFP